MNGILEQNIEHACTVFRGLADFGHDIQRAAALLSGALLNGKKLLACGNGGSAADASHMTTEFVCRFDRDRRPFPAISLATQGGDLTAIGNDYAFVDVFARQVEAFGQPGDVLFAFSSSGASENIRRALIAAKRGGVRTVALLGKDGGVCRGLAEIEFTVQDRITARIQEAHQLLLHTICQAVELHLASTAETVKA